MARGNDAKARRALKSLGYGDADVDKRLANMKLTLEESRLETQSSSYLECFKKSNLRRTMVAVMPTVIQNMGGSYFIMAYLTYFAELSGFSTQQAFRINVGAQAMAFGGCVLSCLLVERVGRRPLNFYGTLVLTVILWVCGGLATKTESASCLKGSVAMFMLYLFVYYSTIGATAIIALAEIATPRLRIMTAAIGVILMNALTVQYFRLVNHIVLTRHSVCGHLRHLICSIRTRRTWVERPLSSLVASLYFQPFTCGSATLKPQAGVMKSLMKCSSSASRHSSSKLL